MPRIYVPEELYWTEPGGNIQLLGHEGENAGSKIYYIVGQKEDNGASSEGLQVIGTISSPSGPSKRTKQKLNFTFDRKENHLILDRISDPEVEIEDTIQLILYNNRTFAHLADTSCKKSEFNSELFRLSKLIRLEQRKRSRIREFSCRIVDKTVQIITVILNLLSFALLPLNWLFKRSAVAQHFREWKIIFRASGTTNSKKKLLPIVIDVFLGLTLMIVISQRINLGAYVMTVTHEIIVYLRKLLESLRGSPVGLKVNVELNNFLLNSFIYHINLWKTFLNIVSPAINYLFAILSIFGMCGLSFQLAMLSDLLVLITIHAHCFYIYAAVLYRLEIVGLKALWRIVLGRRKNVLKNRIESYDYKHSQLFLATLFFSSLLFLLPTVLVYYVVFSTVRLGIYCIIFTLLIIRRRILQLPVYDFTRYLLGIHVSPENVVMEILQDHCNTKVTVIRMKLQRAPIKWTADSKEEFENDYPSVGRFLGDLFKGEIKGFIRPKVDE